MHHRSPKWEKCEKDHLEKFPNCVISGRSDIVRQVHHWFPYEYCIELGRPDLELDSDNLFTIGADPDENFHLYTVHGGYFASFVLDIQGVISLCKGKALHDIMLLSEWHWYVKTRVKPLHSMSALEKQQLRLTFDHLIPRKT